jgi:sec-independent protein translocase protein TatA
MFGLFNLGGGEIILILALILILFGAKKLPELAKGLGQGIKEFKKATRDVNDEFSRAMEDTPPAPAPTQMRLPASTTEGSDPKQPQTVSPTSPGAKA